MYQARFAAYTMQSSGIISRGNDSSLIGRDLSKDGLRSVSFGDMVVANHRRHTSEVQVQASQT